MTLATTGQDGEPYAAAVYFAADSQLQIYFFSSPASQHGRNLGHQPKAAIAFSPDCHSWEEIRGVQMRGHVQLLHAGSGWDYAWQTFASKFPFVRDLSDVVEQNWLYVFKPDWVRVIDNRQGFGFKQEWTIE